MSALHPRAAVRFAANPHRTSDRVSAIVWLSIALLALWVIRNRALPTAPQGATAVAAVAGVVLVGSFAPRVVTYVLAALVIAATLGAAPQLTTFLDNVRAGGVSLSLSGGPGNAGA